MKKIFIVMVVAILVVGSLSFYGGTKYDQSKGSASGGLANLSAEQRQARFQQMGGVNGPAGQRVTRAGNGFTVGEIISKDANSVTVKLNEGGSKIAFIATSTQVMKFVMGSLDDLMVSENITISGLANQDGSLTAQSIQLRPKPATAPQ